MIALKEKNYRILSHNNGSHAKLLTFRSFLSILKAISLRAVLQDATIL